jgi:hypothetical protein
VKPLTPQELAEAVHRLLAAGRTERGVQRT